MTHGAAAECYSADGLWRWAEECGLAFVGSCYVNEDRAEMESQETLTLLLSSGFHKICYNFLWKPDPLPNGYIYCQMGYCTIELHHFFFKF